MKHHALILFLLVVCIATLPAAADESTDPLERQIPSVWSYKSFDEAVQQIDQKTGFKVSCSDEVREYMQTLDLYIGSRHFENLRQFHASATKQAVRAFLDDICRSLGLKWDFNSESGIIGLDFFWKTPFPRAYGGPPLKEHQAQHFLYRPGDGNDCRTNAKWPIAFNALVSCPMNIGRAWKVRQRSHFQGFFPDFSGVGGKPFLTKPVTTTSLQRVMLVIICQPIMVFPGNGSISYYWFKDDGTLLGAGLMNTGHRCALADVTVDNEWIGVDKPTEIQMNLQFNARDPVTARFVLEDTGLKLRHLAGANGENMNVIGTHIGKDLMAPLHTDDDFSAKYSFLDLKFSAITPEIDDRSGAIVGLKADIAGIYPANLRLVSWNQRDGCSVTFEDEHKVEQTLTFRFEELSIPQTLIQKYKLQPGFHIWPKEWIDWRKDTDTKAVR